MALHRAPVHLAVLARQALRVALAHLLLAAAQAVLVHLAVLALQVVLVRLAVLVLLLAVRLVSSVIGTAPCTHCVTTRAVVGAGKITPVVSDVIPVAAKTVMAVLWAVAPVPAVLRLALHLVRLALPAARPLVRPAALRLAHLRARVAVHLSVTAMQRATGIAVRLTVAGLATYHRLHNH